MTEITETRNDPRGILFWDDTCKFCTDGAARFRPMLNRVGIVLEPFENGALEPEMKLRWHDGTVRGGADAAFFMARRIWYLAPLGWLEWVPGCKWIAHRLYRWIARNRKCLGANGTCRIDLEELEK